MANNDRPKARVTLRMKGQNIVSGQGDVLLFCVCLDGWRQQKDEGKQ